MQKRNNFNLIMKETYEEKLQAYVQLIRKPTTYSRRTNIKYFFVKPSFKNVYVRLYFF